MTDINKRLELVKKEIRSISVEIQEKSQNEYDYFMLDHMADQIETSLNLMGLFSE